MPSHNTPESIIEPELAIVDAHHHLWLLPEHALVALEGQSSLAARMLAPVFRRHARYLLDEFKGDLESGHNVRATVFVEGHAMYRTGGPESMKSVGEVEFANGVAAMAASGLFGKTLVCAAIVGSVDLRLGAAAEEILVAHMSAGGARYRGVRSPGTVFDDDEMILGPGPGIAHLLLDSSFREGFKLLRAFDLSFDAWLLEPQLIDLIDLARRFPDTQIVVNHVGAPVGVGRYSGHRQDRFDAWRDSIRTLSWSPNVVVKLGGLGIPFGGFRSYMANPPASSLDLAEEWRPYIETCLETFGVHRCMFESNFPVDAATCTYPVLWNAFKRLTASASSDEKTALFSGTATRVYRIGT